MKILGSLERFSKPFLLNPKVAYSVDVKGGIGCPANFQKCEVWTVSDWVIKRGIEGQFLLLEFFRNEKRVSMSEGVKVVTVHGG